jgi:hypothetical protein
MPPHFSKGFQNDKTPFKKDYVKTIPGLLKNKIGYVTYYSIGNFV